MAEYLGIPHSTIRIPPSSLVRNIPEAVRRADQRRGMIVDELAAHVSVARYLGARGITHVLTGEGADDLFGAFPFALRYFRGAQLKSCARDVIEGLPDELALLQAAYSPEGVTLVHPLLDGRIASDWLPLAAGLSGRCGTADEACTARCIRICCRSGDVHAAKGRVDCTGIRSTLEEIYGTSRERYREMFPVTYGQGSGDAGQISAESGWTRRPCRKHARRT